MRSSSLIWSPLHEQKQSQQFQKVAKNSLVSVIPFYGQLSLQSEIKDNCCQQWCPVAHEIVGGGGGGGSFPSLEDHNCQGLTRFL